MSSPSLHPLSGGHSGETFRGNYLGRDCVVRVYAGRSAARGPDAPEIDAAVLTWLRGLLPVPGVLDVRRPSGDLPGLLFTELLAGTSMADLLPRLGPEKSVALGREVGHLLGRLAGIPLPRAGMFADPSLRIAPASDEYADTETLLAHARDGSRLAWWLPDELDRLAELAREADTVLDAVDRVVLVHSDFNPKNVLVDPDTLRVTGLVDWEFCHAGHPYADLGNLIRFERGELADAAVAAREETVSDPRPDPTRLARAADLLALIDLATRRGENPVADRADAQLRQIARSGDLNATAPPAPA